MTTTTSSIAERTADFRREFRDFWRADPLTDLIENFMIKTDSYKVTHFPQYPKGTTKISSYMESRGCTPKDLEGNDLYKYTTFFGLQYTILRHFTGQQVTHDKIDQAKQFFKQHFGGDLFNEAGWRYIADKYDGYLPIKIKAVREGKKVGLKNVLFVIENEDPNCFWLTNYCETLLSQVWYSTTVATNSSHARDFLKKYHEKTTDNPFVDFSLHDFGARGGSTYETSLVGGMSHLVSFNGSDTMAAVVLANKAYNSSIFGQAVINLRIDATTMYAFSVVATEHSTMTSWGRWRERECVLNLLRTFPNGIISIVGDSYDIFAFTRMLYQDEEIHDLIVDRGNRGAKFVLRPDSGDPVEIDTKLVQMLYEGFGGKVNGKGYKELPSYIGLIQGDGIDLVELERILIAFDELGFAANNIVFGSGGGLIQKFDRDTLKFAIKCSFAVIDGEEVDIQKDPVTSKGKKSKKGRLGLFVDETGRLYTEQELDALREQEGLLELVFTHGMAVNLQTFDEVREEARRETPEYLMQMAA